MTRLLLVADLHLEKGMDYAEDRLAEQEEVWAQALRVGDECDVDAVLFAGDATEYRQPSSAARAAFQRPLSNRLTPVLAIPGNHDVRHPRHPTALDLMAPALGGNLLKVSSQPDLVPLAGCVVATLPWTSIGNLVASRNGGGREAAFDAAEQALVEIAESLASQAARLHPGVPTVLLGHWALDFTSTPTGMSATEFHESVLPTDRLAEMFDAVVFGHVHRPQQQGNVVSPGSPLPLDFGEAGCAHGVWILDFDAAPEEPEDRFQFVPIESRPFVTLDLGADEAESISDGWGVSVNVDGAIVRVRYTATEEQAARISDARLREWILRAGAHRVWQIAPQIERANRARVAEMGALHPYDAIDAWIEARGVTLEGVRERAREVLQA